MQTWRSNGNSVQDLNLPAGVIYGASSSADIGRVEILTPRQVMMC